MIVLKTNARSESEMMNRTSIGAMAVATSLASAAMAETAPAWMEPAFGNTIVTTYPTGKVTRMWLDRDGKYELLRSTGKRNGGRWTVKGDKVCFRQTRPVSIPFTFCQARLTGGIGTRWTGKSPAGERVTNVLVAGQEGR